MCPEIRGQRARPSAIAGLGRYPEQQARLGQDLHHAGPLGRQLEKALQGVGVGREQRQQVQKALLGNGDSDAAHDGQDEADDRSWR